MSAERRRSRAKGTITKASDYKKPPAAPAPGGLSEAETVSGKTFVTLGGKRVAMRIKTIRETGTFGYEVGAIISGYLQGRKFTDAFAAFTKKAELKRDAKSGEGAKDMLEFAAALLPRLLGEGFETIERLLWAYAPELREHAYAANAEGINSERQLASDEEIMDAGLKALELGFPFVLKAAKAIWTAAAPMIERQIALAKAQSTS